LTSTVIAQVKPYAPEIFPDNISAAVCGFNKEGNRIYFVREDTTKKKLLLYEADWKGSKWNNARLLPFSGMYNDYGGRLTSDGNTFYFASDRPGASDNKLDLWNIWKVIRTTSGWNEPEPLKEISNKGDECCPVPFVNDGILFSGTRDNSEWQIYKADNSSVLLQNVNNASAWQWPSYYDAASGTMFFNSMKRPDSKGKDDIYSVNFIDGKWSNVRNLEEINTAAYEDGAILSPDRTLLIFCRHDTATAPSRVLCVKIENVLKDFDK
jgi:hypothetical protein